MDNLSSRIKSKVIEKAIHSKSKEFMHDGSKRSIRVQEYNDKLKKIRKETAILGDLDCLDEIDDLMVFNEPTAMTRAFPQAAMLPLPPHSSRNVLKTDTLLGRDLIVEEKVIEEGNDSNLSLESKLAVLGFEDKEQIDGHSDCDMPDPKKVYNKTDRRDIKKPNTDVIYKMHFSDLNKPKKNLKISIYKSKKDDQYKKLVCNVVYENGKYRNDQNLLNQIIENLKDADDLNMHDQSRRPEFQKLTDVDTFFLRNYFNMIGMNLDHHTIDFQEDLYRDDNNVFKRVEACD